MRTYIAFYRGAQKTVNADTSYGAQKLAAALFRAKKEHQVTVVLADVPVNTASIG